MPTAIFISPDESVAEIDVKEGSNLMRAAVSHGIDSIVGDCGGALSCATCHVLVDPAFLALLPPVSDNEDQMLDCTASPREANSRLSCQIVMTAALDGISVRVADQQL